MDELCKFYLGLVVESKLKFLNVIDLIPYVRNIYTEGNFVLHGSNSVFPCWFFFIKVSVNLSE